MTKTCDSIIGDACKETSHSNTKTKPEIDNLDPKTKPMNPQN